MVRRILWSNATQQIRVMCPSIIMVKILKIMEGAMFWMHCVFTKKIRTISVSKKKRPICVNEVSQSEKICLNSKIYVSYFFCFQIIKGKAPGK